MKKPIAVYEDYLDQLSVTTVEKDNAKEVNEILNINEDNSNLTERLIKVLVSKGVISFADFKRVLGD